MRGDGSKNVIDRCTIHDPLHDALTRNTEDVGEEPGEMEEFPIKNAVDPILDICPFSDKKVAQPGHLPEVAVVAWHDPGRRDHPFESQKSDHLRVDLIGLLMSKHFDVVSIPDDHRNLIAQQIINAHPIIRSGLTGDHSTVMFEYPILQSK